MIDTTRLAGRETSRIGLGCGRLVGGAGAKASRAVVEEALRLGIRHFDVAPSYGLGLAEDVLGEVLAGVAGATVATKVGIARPGHAGAKALVRQLLRPLLGAAPALRARLARGVGGPARGLFAPEQVERSFAESLHRLRRDRVDALLLHQPGPADLTDTLAETMAGFVTDGRAGAVGSGTGGDRDALVPFGTVRQYRFGSAPVADGGDTVLHGVLRMCRAPPAPGSATAAAVHAMGRDPGQSADWPATALTLALASRPGTVLLISSTSPARLHAAVAGIDWALVRAPSADALAAAAAVFGPPIAG